MAGWRLARAVGTVIALGAAGGAVAGLVAFAGLGLVLGVSPRVFVGAGDVAKLAMSGALVGSLAGAVLGPLAGFGFLRHVPLGRAIAFGVAGTLAGFAAGMVLQWGVIGLTVGGFALGVWAARRHAATPGSRTAAVDAAEARHVAAADTAGQLGAGQSGIATSPLAGRSPDATGRRPPAAT